MAGIPFIFRVHRTKVDGETVEIRLEPFTENQTLHPEENDEFITGELAVNPWANDPYA